MQTRRFKEQGHSRKAFDQGELMGDRPTLVSGIVLGLLELGIVGTFLESDLKESELGWIHGRHDKVLTLKRGILASRDGESD